MYPGNVDRKTGVMLAHIRRFYAVSNGSSANNFDRKPHNGNDYLNQGICPNLKISNQKIDQKQSNC